MDPRHLFLTWRRQCVIPTHVNMKSLKSIVIQQCACDKHLSAWTCRATPARAPCSGSKWAQSEGWTATTSAELAQSELRLLQCQKHFSKQSSCRLVIMQKDVTAIWVLRKFLLVLKEIPRGMTQGYCSNHNACNGLLPMPEMQSFCSLPKINERSKIKQTAIFSICCM